MLTYKPHDLGENEGASTMKVKSYNPDSHPVYSQNNKFISDFFYTKVLVIKLVKLGFNQDKLKWL